MKIEVGKSYRTRDGRKAYITHENDGVEFLYSARVDGRSGYTYTVRGNYDVGRESKLDLIAEWRDPEEPKGATLSADTIDQIAVDSLLWHFYEYGELGPLQKEAFRIVLSYYGKQV